MIVVVLSSLMPNPYNCPVTWRRNESSSWVFLCVRSGRVLYMRKHTKNRRQKTDPVQYGRALITNKLLNMPIIISSRLYRYLGHVLEFYCTRVLFWQAYEKRFICIRIVRNVETKSKLFISLREHSRFVKYVVHPLKFIGWVVRAFTKHFLINRNGIKLKWNGHHENHALQRQIKGVRKNNKAIKPMRIHTHTQNFI